MLLQYFVGGRDITGKACRLLAGATDSDRVTGDCFPCQLPLLVSAVGDGGQPHNRDAVTSSRCFLHGFRAVSYSEIIWEESIRCEMVFNGH